MGLYLFKLSPMLSFSIVIIFIPNIFSQLIRIKVFTKAEDDSVAERRKYEYYEQCMIGREYFKETRLLGVFSYFMNLYLKSIKNVQIINYKATKKTGMVDLLLSIMTILGYGGVLYLLFHSLMIGQISIGGFVAIFASIGSIYDMIDNLLRNVLGRMSDSFGFISNYINFMDYNEFDAEHCDIDVSEGIDVHNIEFSYPNSDRKVINNINLHINPGETIAIVGENGSGKSTFIRLLLGLYTPDKGEILYSGKHIRGYNRLDIFAHTSAVFQKFQKYQMTLYDNISISDSHYSENNDIERICDISGVDLTKNIYNDGLNTMLSREFGGIDLSGGEWQRIAIARAFYKNHDFIVLDEPTSAIDPFEESRIYNQFAQISRDKTTIIVTHRLGSVKLADKIIVMKDGNIEQIGTHDELVRNEGEYKRLYKSQEQWYV
jgi:ATP-binding cassette subfamily B protein